jgi:hypothetical protein
MAKTRYPYSVVDTFNNIVLSHHATLKNAVKAEVRFRKAFARKNHGGCNPTTVNYLGEKMEGDDEEHYYVLLEHYTHVRY